MKTKVLIVDDSAIMRHLLNEILSMDPNLEVVGTAADPYIARDMIMRLNPDVLTLDVEMPRMDGLTFLEKLMASHPMPVVMVSSLTQKGCETTLRALELGAVDFVAKPKVNMAEGLREIAREIVLKVRVAAGAKVRCRPKSTQLATENKTTLSAKTFVSNTPEVIAIGASTGGTEAITEVLSKLPKNSPGVIAVIHMPAGFTKSFADRLNRYCKINVKEAEHGDQILPGQALIAPGDFHMTAFRCRTGYSVHVAEGDKVRGFRPSVDVLFNSCAQHVGGNSIGIILTGMGSDGADGLLEMRNAGARTIGQNEATCVVYGMPREAHARGGVEEVRPLPNIAQAALRMCSDQPVVA